MIAANMVASFAFAVASFGLCYQLFALWAVERFARGRVREASAFPPLCLLKALRGAEPRLKENLESFCTQSYPSAVEFVFGVHAPDDPAIPVVASLKRDYPGLVCGLALSGPHSGVNPKIANLAAMAPLMRHDVLVLSDSDIRVPPDYLKAIAGALEEPGAGAVTCCYLGEADGGLWSRMSAMGIDYQFLPSVIAGVALGFAAPCFGSTIAMRRNVLDEIGGFAAFSGKLADDYEMGRAVRLSGRRIVLSPLIVHHMCPESSMPDLFRHELRWARTILTVEPWGFAGTIATHVVPMALIAAILSGFSGGPLLLAAAALLSRLALKARVDRLFGVRGLPAILLPLRDIFSFAVFAAAFFGRQVEWRGRHYALSPGGALTREC